MCSDFQNGHGCLPTQAGQGVGSRARVVIPAKAGIHTQKIIAPICLGQCLSEVGDQIIHMLQPNRDTNQIIRGLGVRAFYGCTML